MAKFEVGDIVLYAPPNLDAQDYSKRCLNAVGIVTDELQGSPPKPPNDDETHVNWICIAAALPNPSRHYTKNLKKLGHIMASGPDEVRLNGAL